MNADPPRARSSCLLSWAALGVAVLGQQVLTPLGRSRALMDLPEAGIVPGFSLLIAAGVLAATAVWRDPHGCDGDDRAYGKAGDEPNLALLRAGGLSGVIATLMVLFDPGSALAIVPWGLALVLLVVACRQRERVERGGALADWIAPVLLVLLAVPFRFVDLATIPSQVHGDEAACGLQARMILGGEIPNLLSVGWYDIPYLSFAISVPAMALFGDDLFGLRLTSAVLGTASVALLYALVVRMYGRRVAAVAAFSMAVSHWHVHFSRIGTDYMQASFAGLLALYFLVRARQEGRLVDWVWLGIAVGVAASVYHAGRVVPLVVAAYLVGERTRLRAIDRRGIALAVAAAILFVAPTVAVLTRLPEALTDRSKNVFVFSDENLEHTYAETGVDTPLRALGQQVIHSFTAFNRRGERSGQHSHRAPLLDFWTGAIFVCGWIGFSAIGWHRRHRLLAIWFWSSFVLGSVLTVDAMFSPRMIVALPAVFVFVGLFVEQVATSSRQAFGAAGGRLAGALLFALLGASVWANWSDYFVLHAGRLQPRTLATILAQSVAGLQPTRDVYVFGRESMQYDTGRFLVPDFNGVDAGERRLEMPVASSDRGLAFVIDRHWTEFEAQRRAIVAAYPDARSETVARDNGRPAFEVLLVDRAPSSSLNDS